MKTQIQDSPHMDDKPFDDNSTGFMWKKNTVKSLCKETMRGRSVFFIHACIRYQKGYAYVRPSSNKVFACFLSNPDSFLVIRIPFLSPDSFFED